jgi:hypothetical protein
MNVRSVRWIVLLAALPLAGCGSVLPSHPESTLGTTPHPSATISPTASPSARTTVVTFAGARSGVLSAVTSQCSNQYPGVQATGTLDGNTYNVSIGDPSTPTPGQGEGNQVLEWLGPENLTSTASYAWESVSNAGVTDYNLATGATFNVQLPPDSSAPETTGILYVSGLIVC